MILGGGPVPLRRSVPWSPPLIRITVATDASDVGWGFQSSWGHQACGRWLEDSRCLHINLQELMVVKVWFEHHPDISSIGIRFNMNNMMAVQCMQRQGTACSDLLLALSEDIFAEASRRTISRSPGWENN